MKFMVTWTALPGTVKEAVAKFVAGEAAPQEGVALLGRWHSVDLSIGFSLYETDKPVQLYKGASIWAGLMELRTIPVIEDAEAGPILASMFKK